MKVNSNWFVSLMRHCELQWIHAVRLGLIQVDTPELTCAAVPWTKLLQGWRFYLLKVITTYNRWKCLQTISHSHTNRRYSGQIGIKYLYVDISFTNFTKNPNGMIAPDFLLQIRVPRTLCHANTHLSTLSSCSPFNPCSTDLVCIGTLPSKVPVLQEHSQIRKSLPL